MQCLRHSHSGTPPHHQTPALAPKLQSSLIMLGPRKVAVRRPQHGYSMNCKKKKGCVSCPITPHPQSTHTQSGICRQAYHVVLNRGLAAGLPVENIGGRMLGASDRRLCVVLTMCVNQIRPRCSLRRRSRRHTRRSTPCGRGRCRPGTQTLCPGCRAASGRRRPASCRGRR